MTKITASISRIEGATHLAFKNIDGVLYSRQTLKDGNKTEWEMVKE